MMYEELVKVLRKTDISDGCPCEAEEWCKDKDCIICQAAYAIEELQGKTKVLEKLADHWCNKVPKWIPVTERLPDSWGHYFVFIIGGECRQISWTTVAYFEGKIFRWEHFGQEYSEEVTHWMPLPEPPEKEDIFCSNECEKEDGEA